MKGKRFTEEQMIGIIKELDAGVPLKDVCRKHAVSDGTIYKWKAKLGGMQVSDARRLRTIEEENRKLKRVVADLVLDNVVLKDLVSKKW